MTVFSIFLQQTMIISIALFFVASAVIMVTSAAENRKMECSNGNVVSSSSCSLSAQKDATSTSSLSALARAQALDAPTPHSSVGGEYEDHEWWVSHEDLFSKARQEWGRLHPELYDAQDHVETFEERFVRNEFRNRFRNVWVESSVEHETSVRDLFQETNAPGVYGFQMFTDEFHQLFMEELDYQISSGIPLRRPNGMNRYGAILSELGLDSIVTVMIDRYFRPVGQLLYPEFMGTKDAEEHFSFVVRYKMEEDVELAEHTDASVVTINLCLGKPGFEGGSLYFKGLRWMNNELNENGAALPTDTAAFAQRNEIVMEPGMGIIHLGRHEHAALPLTGGERTNMIVWLSGEHGVVRIAKYSKEEMQEAAAMRWYPRID